MEGYGRLNPLQILRGIETRHYKQLQNDKTQSIEQAQAYMRRGEGVPQEIQASSLTNFI